MRDPELIWRLGQWLARRRTGEARLSGAGIELVLRVADGRIVAIEGPDSRQIATRLRTRPRGHRELLAEASAIAAHDGLAEPQSVAVAKEILQEGLGAWLNDPDRRLAIDDVDVAAGEGPTISAAHAVVEMVLSSQGAAINRAILPDLDVLLRRAPNFLELYSPLRLSEEADLIVAKVTGQRTAREISERSPHGPDEVIGLLAALVAAGMLEPIPPPEPDEETEPAPALPPLEPEPVRRRLPLWAILAALAAAVVILVLIATVWGRPGDSVVAPTTGGPEWGLVVDLGCEPQELQRVLRKAHQYPDELQPVAAEASEGSPCWRLVWGRFPDRETAQAAVKDIPSHLRLEGFSPHPIELPSDGRPEPSATGD